MFVRESTRRQKSTPKAQYRAGSAISAPSTHERPNEQAVHCSRGRRGESMCSRGRTAGRRAAEAEQASKWSSKCSKALFFPFGVAPAAINCIASNLRIDQGSARETSQSRDGQSAGDLPRAAESAILRVRAGTSSSAAPCSGGPHGAWHPPEQRFHARGDAQALPTLLDRRGGLLRRQRPHERLRSFGHFS